MHVNFETNIDIVSVSIYSSSEQTVHILVPLQSALSNVGPDDDVYMYYKKQISKIYSLTHSTYETYRHK